MSTVEAQEAVDRWLAEHADLGPRLSDEIFDLAEPGLCEFESSRLLADTLAEAGFDVEFGTAGLPTSFVARYGSGEPVIGLMCENDATPGDSQQTVPRHAPVSPTASGFVDLHNGIGAASVAAALALKAAKDELGFAGTIVVYGTAAEKLCIGKPFLARDGYFDDLSAVVAWHPRPYTTAEWDAGPGCYQIEVFEFDGIPVYGARPWDGKSALDALTLMNMAVQFRREHLPPGYQATVNEFVTRGGMHPTSLPNSAEAWYVHRANSVEGIETVSRMLEDAAEGASRAIGVGYRRNIISATRPWLPNHAMARIAERTLRRVGAPDVPPSMLPFANEVLANLGREPMVEPFDRRVTPVDAGITAEFGGGADDVNEFTWHAPTTRIYIAYGLGAYGLPNWAQSAFARTAAAHATVRAASRAVAGTAAELFTDADALAAARGEYEARIADVGYLPPRLPADATAPVDAASAPPFVRDYLLAAARRDA